MVDRISSTPPAAPRIGPMLLMAALASVVFPMELHPGDWTGLWQEDLLVYSHAVTEWLAGRNPYTAAQAPHYFLYPPAFLYVAGAFSHLLSPHLGFWLYAIVSLAAVVALPLLLARYYFRQPWLTPLFAVLLFFASPRFTGILVLAEMNVASIFYLLIFAGAVPGIRKNRWGWFYAAVIAAALVKITFLSLLLLPLLTGKKQWLRSIGCGVVVIAANLGERWLWPALYAGYQWSLRQGIVSQSVFGYGVFGAVATYHARQRGGPGPAAYAAFAVVSVCLIVAMFALRRRVELVRDVEVPVQQDTNFDGIWLALVVSAILLLNPRDMHYDMDIAVFATFPLWVYGLRTRRLLTLMVALFVPSTIVPLVVLNPNLYGLYETFITLAGFGVGFWRFWHETERRKGVISLGDAAAARRNGALVAS